MKLGVLLALAAVLPLVSFIPALFPQPSLILIIGAVVWLWLSLEAARRGQKFLENSLTIQFWGTARVVLPRFFSAFVIFLSVLFYLNYFVWGKYNEQIGKDFIFETLRFSESIAQIWVANLSFDKPVQDGLKALAEMELRQQRTSLVVRTQSGDFTPDYNQLPPVEKAQVLTQVSSELQTYLEKFTGPLNPQAPLKNAVYDFVKKYVGDFESKTEPWFGMIVTILVFFALRGLTAILSPVARFLAFVIYRFLLAVGFAYISLESRRHEFILLS